MTKWEGWKAVIRDVVMIFLLTAIGGIIIGFFTAGEPSRTMTAIAVSNIFLGSLGFFISGCLTAENRWKHLITVAVFVWLASVINLFIGPATLKNWIFSIFVIFLMMVIGGGVSFLLKKPEKKGVSYESD